MKIIKGVLEEELKNSLRMQEDYEKVLAALPRGVLVQKFVKGHQEVIGAGGHWGHFSILDKSCRNFRDRSLMLDSGRNFGAIGS